MKKHRWSGWPGAYCLDCGSEDPSENAMAMGWLECYPDENGNHIEKWDTEEHRKIVEEKNVCQRRKS